MIKIIFADLDGTLLKDDKTVSDFTLDTLNGLYHKGIVFIPATGRNLGGIPEGIRKVKGVRYFLTANGAAIFEVREDRTECIYEALIPDDAVRDIIALSRKLGVMADPFEADKAYTDSFNLAVLEKAGVSEAVMDYIKSNRVILDSVPDYYTKARPHINKITMNFALDEEGRPVGKEEVLRYIGSRSDITAVTGGANNIEVTSVRATKGGAVRFLAERLGADMGDIMCIGDSENDISMLKAAGTGVCMKNSDAKVIAAADFVADSNEEDGAAKAILKYTGGEERCI